MPGGVGALRDSINLLAGSRPVGVAAMESPRGDDGGMYQDSLERTDHWCAFSREIQNHDGGSAIIMYENELRISRLEQATC
jgi:hypothetical protein